nr:MAG TPA: tail protein [Caudoviricetes sp.]
MSAGTITVTNGSTTVTGSGTSFTTELKVGDFICVIAGGTPYTLIVASIASNTQLTIGGAFAGPTASGLAWNAVPASLLYAVTQQIMNDMGTALRGMNSQLVNWQKIYSDASSVTVERSDRTTFTGPSWGYMAQQYASKANTADVLAKADNLNGLTDKAAARTNLGLKGAAVLDVGSASGTVAAGNDSRLGTVDGKSGGTISSGVTLSSGNLSLSTGAVQTTRNNMTARQPWNGTNGSITQGGWFQSMYSVANTTAQFSSFIEAVVNQSLYGVLTLGDGAQFKRWQFDIGGNAYAINGNWINGSDARLKKDIKPVPNALQSVLGWRGASWEWRDKSRKQRGLGLIADDVEKAFPDAISRFATEIDGEMFSDVRGIDPGSVAAAYHTEAIKSLFSLVELALVSPEKALESIDSIKAAIAANTGA